MTAAEDEVTVAKIVKRLGGGWPATEPTGEPRHLLEEPEPEPGELTAFWFGPAPTPRAELDDEDQPPSLVRQYVLPASERTNQRTAPPPKGEQ